MYLIQGFFYQRVTGLGAGYAPGEGAVAIVQSGFAPYMFAGSMWHQHNITTNPLMGSMMDDIGASELDDILITEKKITFLKRYHRDGGVSGALGIAYSFAPDSGNTWLGEYRLPTSGNKEIIGPARCILTKVDAKLFENDLAVYAKKNGFKKKLRRA